jgi:hypothetical protein
LDINTTDTIPTYQVRAKVLSTHPADSFTMETDNNGYAQLIIKDKKQFWSVSKYLVLRVN